MKHVSTLMIAMCMGLATRVYAADPVQATQQTQAQEQNRIYGTDLMSAQEGAEYQNKMRALKTEQEREAFQIEHHKKMQERAKLTGKTLPDMPQQGSGMGTSPGRGRR